MIRVCDIRGVPTRDARIHARCDRVELVAGLCQHIIVARNAYYFIISFIPGRSER